jgi:hypothetical protein
VATGVPGLPPVAPYSFSSVMLSISKVKAEPKAVDSMATGVAG